MNANELAKGLSQNQIYGDDYGLFNKRIQNMLRQQQTEIEALKGEVAYLKHINRNWAISEGLVLKEIKALKAKTLTDEEIEELREYHGINDWLYETSVTDFARAILRKAQEK